MKSVLKLMLDIMSIQLLMLPIIEIRKPTSSECLCCVTFSLHHLIKSPEQLYEKSNILLNSQL